MKNFKHFLTSISLIAVVLALVIPLPSDAFINIPQAISTMMAYWMNTYYTVLLLLLGVFEALLNMAIQVAYIPDFVRAGWQASANIANAFFILVLLAIAIGTILRIQAYNFKKTLPRFVISVVLVNFSFFFCVFLFGLSNNIARALAGGGTSISAAVQNAVQLQKMPTLSGESCFTTDPATGVQTPCASGSPMPDTIRLRVIESVAAVFLPILRLAIMVCVVSILIIILALFSLLLILRLVVLWILVSLAPLPYLFDILPGTQKYSKMWWDKFNQFLLIGPVFGLFLYFMTEMIRSFTPNVEGSTFTQMKIGEKMSAYSVFIGGATQGGIGPMEALIVAILLLVYGVAAIVVAMKLGAVGAAFVNTGIQKGIGAVKGAASKQAAKVGAVVPVVGSNAQIQRTQDKVKNLDTRLDEARKSGNADEVNKILKEKAELDIPDKKNLNLEQQARVSKLEKQREASLAAYQKGAGVEDPKVRMEKQLEKLDADRVSALQKDGNELKDATDGELARKFAGGQEDTAVAAAIMQGGDSLEKLMQNDAAFKGKDATPEAQRKFIEKALGKAPESVKAAMFAQHAKRQKAENNFAPEIEARANAEALEHARVNNLEVKDVPESVRTAARQKAAKAVRKEISKRSGKDNARLSDETFSEVAKWDAAGGALENNLDMSEKDLENATPSMKRRMRGRGEARAKRRETIDRDILNAKDEVDRLARDPRASAAQSQAARDKLKRLEDEKKAL